jgi:elongation factor Tu
MIKYGLLLLALCFFAAGPVHAGKIATISGVNVASGDFLMPVNDVFYINGYGTVVTGTILRGNIRVGDSVDIVGINESVIRTTVKSIELFKKTVTEAKEADECGLLLAFVKPSDVSRGMVLAKPGSIFPVKKISCEVIFKTKEDGGRKYPIADNFRTQVRIYNTTSSAKIRLREGVQNITPAEKTNVTLEFEKPVAVETGLTFSIMEYGKEIGSGTITAIIKN